MKLKKPEGLLRGQLDIYIDFRSGFKFKDAKGVECGVHDTETRTWQHLNFLDTLVAYMHEFQESNMAMAK